LEQTLEPIPSTLQQAKTSGMNYIVASFWILPNFL
jgi:hypothetical protein